jgi:uncharacterized membrane protein
VTSDRVPEEPDVSRNALDWIVPLAVAFVFVAAGMVFRTPCVRHLGALDYSERHLCYTDVYALYRVEGLDQGRVPYFDARPDGKFVEYPVLTGVWMYATARISTAVAGDAHRGDARGYSTYFWVNQAGFGFLIIAAAVALGLLAGWRRALLFAAAPTLILHGGVSWDVLAVTPFVLGIYFFARREDALSGLLLGVGAAAKLFPIFALPFLAVQRFREGNRRGALTLTGAGLGATALINVPFALGASRGWREFFRLNSQRPADWDSIWYHLQTSWHITFKISRLNAITAFLFVAGVVALLVWQWRRSARGTSFLVPGIQTATGVAVFLGIVWFLMVNKVWSPQYGIWLLPFWAFAVPVRSWGLAATWFAFQVMDVFVFVTRFWMFAHKTTYEWFRAAIFSRLGAFLILLVLLLVTSARRPRDDVPVTTAEAAA